jgi:hypothetical protein
VRQREQLARVTPGEDVPEDVGAGMKNSSASGIASRRSRRVSIVYVGPPRSMSTRETVNRGFDAVAITVIRYRCSGGATLRADFCQGCPVGTNMTSSRPNQAWTSLAATRWP